MLALKYVRIGKIKIIFLKSQPRERKKKRFIGKYIFIKNLSLVINLYGIKKKKKKFIYKYL